MFIEKSQSCMTIKHSQLDLRPVGCGQGGRLRETGVTASVTKKRVKSNDPSFQLSELEKTTDLN